MLGPLSGGYPGRFVSICFIAYVACLYGFQLRRFLKWKKARSESHPTIQIAPSRKDPSASALVGFGIVCAVFIFVALWDIYTHWPN
jgi:hypothetical protein